MKLIILLLILLLNICYAAPTQWSSRLTNYLLDQLSKEDFSAAFVESLLADPEFDKAVGLEYAAAKGMVETVDLILKKYPNLPKQKAFFKAVESNHPLVVERMMQESIDLMDIVYAVNLASTYGHDQIIDVLIGHSPSNVPLSDLQIYLMRANILKHPNEQIFESGSNKIRQTILQRIFSSPSKTEILDHLIKTDAKVDYQHILDFAAEKGILNMVKLLMTRLQLSTSSAITKARKGKNLDVLFYLLNHPNSAKEKSIVLENAFEHGHLEVVKLVSLSYLEIRDGIRFAASLEHFDLLRYLLSLLEKEAFFKDLCNQIVAELVDFRRIKVVAWLFLNYGKYLDKALKFRTTEDMIKFGEYMTTSRFIQ